jgi:hypothetical protein
LWLRDKIAKYNCSTEKVLELGCFDGKTIEFLDRKPLEYEGYDANWEGGLDLGQQIWKDNLGYRFKLCNHIDQFTPVFDYFDISVCQETAEHLPVIDLEEYIKRLADATKSYCFISVPNEKGLMFLLKHLTKVITQEKNEQQDVSFMDIVNSTFGRLNRVERDVRSHKGFDYKELEKILAKYFEVVEVSSIPINWAPIRLSFTVGYVCKKVS